VIFEVVDYVTTLLGPELEEASEELSELGQRCRDEGIDPLQLGEAVSSAVAVLLGEDVTPDMTKAWKVTFDSLANRMSVISNHIA
jgi:hemoglobin-like flavoprotein